MKFPGELKVISLGGNHDLTDHIKTLYPSARYVRLEGKRYSGAANR